MNILKVLLISSLFFAAPLIVKAYDKTGHRIVAKIASENLTAKANAEVEKILGKNGLVNYCNWADEVRSDHNFDYAAKWHYLNVEDNYPADRVDSLFNNALTSKNNILFAIDSLTKVLAANKHDTIALKFLIHFIGDLFQPLHFGKASDLGGNLVKIKWFKDSVNLHALWDTYLVNFEQYSYSEYAAYLLSSQSFTNHNYSLKEAFFSSYQYSRKIYDYDYSRMNEYKYYYLFSPELKESLLNGGYFLAATLNKIYG